MSGSALLGHTPNNQDDRWIVLGFFRANGIPEAAYRETSIIPIEAPPNAPHDSHKEEIVVRMAIVMSLIILITVTRLSLRLFRKDLRWGWDDWTIILGMLGAIAWATIALAAANYGGAGRHLYDLTYSEFNIYLSLMWTGQVLFYPTVGLIKISIVLFNRRLTGLTSRKWMIVHNIFLVLLVCYIVISIFVNVFLCVPVPRKFQALYVGKMATPPWWMKSKPLVPTLSAIHVVFDFALLTVPLIVLYQMKMNLSKKIRLCFLFSIGAISTIGAVMRSVVQNQTQTDITYQFPDYIRWSIIDIIFAITVASLPTLNNLIPKSWDHPSRDSNSGGALALPRLGDSATDPTTKTQIAEPRVQELASDTDSRTLWDEESGSGRGRKESGSTGVGTHPDWDEYHPEIKLPV